LRFYKREKRDLRRIEKRLSCRDIFRVSPKGERSGLSFNEKDATQAYHGPPGPQFK